MRPRRAPMGSVTDAGEGVNVCETDGMSQETTGVEELFSRSREDQETKIVFPEVDAMVRREGRKG